MNNSCLCMLNSLSGPPTLLGKTNNCGLNLQFCFVKWTIHVYACVCMHMHAYACVCMHMHAYFTSQVPYNGVDGFPSAITLSTTAIHVLVYEPQLSMCLCIGHCVSAIPMCDMHSVTPVIHYYHVFGLLCVCLLIIANAIRPKGLNKTLCNLSSSRATCHDVHAFVVGGFNYAIVRRQWRLRDAMGVRSKPRAWCSGLWPLDHRGQRLRLQWLRYDCSRTSDPMHALEPKRMNMHGL